MKILNSKYVTLTLVGFALAFGNACTKREGANSSMGPADDRILIGEVGSMTGSEATFGTSTHNGALMAIDEINAKGGIKGKKVYLISLDDQGKPEEAATAITKLITQNKVNAVIGEVASSRSLAMAPIAQQHHTPMLSPSSTNPKVTEQGDFIFRACFIDPFQGSVMAKFAIESLKAKRVAILRDVKNDYSIGLADFFIKTFKQKGGTIVVDQSYSAGDVDFKAQLTSIRTHKPDAIFVPGYYTEVGLIAKQAKELGIQAPLLGGDGWDSPKLTEIGKDSINGSYFSNHYTADDKSEFVQTFVTKFKQKFGEVPDGLAALGYDAMMIMADAMARSKTLIGVDVRSALAATQNFKGVTGTISMDPMRNPSKSAVVLKVDEGKYKYQTTIHP